MHNSRVGDLETAALTPAAEAALQAHVEAAGGRVLEPDLTALEALMADTVQLLCEIDAALLPPIILDRVPRDTAV